MKKLYLKIGDEGKSVLKAQKLLKMSGSSIAVTGQYTVAMVSAVRSFQKKNGLEVTGKIDNITMKVLKKQNSLWKRFCKKFCGHKK